MLDTATVISVATSVGSALVVIYTTGLINRENVRSVKESLVEFKLDIKAEILKEKAHAMQLAQQRIGTIEKDVDEIFPRLRSAEDNVKKNCYVLTNIQRDCKRRHKEALDEF